MLPYHRKLLSAVSGGAFQVDAVTFDGASDYLNRGADLTGNADGKQGIVSFWVNFNSDDSVTDSIYETPNNKFRILREEDTKDITIQGSDSGNTQRLFLRVDNPILATDGWTHVLAAWDLANTTAQLYVNDVSDVSATTAQNADLDYTETDHTIGATPSGTDKLNADLAEFYFNTDEYLDLSVEANRRKFIDANGKPVDLGSDGSLPTGTSPIIYLNGPATGFETNNGTGGNFTENGALTDASTSPSD